MRIGAVVCGVSGGVSAGWAEWVWCAVRDVRLWEGVERGWLAARGIGHG